ncbi:hypothetical protein [Microbacterium sp. GCS4]|uniref:hypothetical protein n=1 Tax=Microbacterium sp. GCS4 TaxID=1692239 RepID=UPI00067F95F0|nr:hypothetical protein [Microbacterium sp. GCS4]KNY05268.1 hypothetical protein AKH00_12945 [Microbacterium sp. GCS4]
MPSVNPLLVADHRAGTLFSLDASSRRVVVPDAWLAEHAGFLRLPPAGNDSWAFADDRGGALVVGGPDGVRRIPIAIPAEHLAASPDGRHVVVTPGLGANEEAWNDVVTVVDLARNTSVRFRTRAGEPGVLIVPDRVTGRPMIVLRHRDPGAIEAIPLADALALGAHVPVLHGSLCSDVADDGHGDIVDHATGVVGVATGRGLETFAVDDGVPRALGAIPWPAEGRAYYLRRAGDTGHATGVLRGGPADPSRWTEWTNVFAEIDLHAGASRTVPLPPGLAFRFALAEGRAAAAVIHPDGDVLVEIDRDAGRVLRTVPLPPLGAPPQPGRMPWDAVDGRPAQRRAVAIDPHTGTVAVTAGGDGAVRLIDGDDRITTIAMPDPLDEGGHLLWAGRGGEFTDPVGR